MRLYQKILAGLAAGALLLLSGDFSYKNQVGRAEARQSLERRLEADYLEERIVPSIFEKPTEADELTIKTLVKYINNYYDKLDKLIDSGKTFHEKESNIMVSDTVNSPIVQHIWTQNPELRDFIQEKTNNNPRLTGDQLVECLNAYLLKIGYCFIHHQKDAGFGEAHSFRLAKISKITQLRGTVWGNIIDNKVYHVEWPILAEEYYEKRSKDKEKTVYSAVAAGEIILINSESYQFALNKVLKELKNLNIQEVKNQDDLSEVLLKKGLKTLSRVSEEYVERRMRLDLFHEAMHVIFRRTYKEPDNPEQKRDYRNFNEVAAFLAQLKNEKTDFIYYELGNIFDLRNHSYYEKANKIIFNHFLKLIVSNKQNYPNIDFANYRGDSDGEVLILQLHKLSIEQISELAKTCFNEIFPQLDKTYNPEEQIK